MRIESFRERSISERESSVRLTCSTMFDWPEHSHTSPISTSFDDAIAPDSARTLSVYGPPAFIAGSVASQRPLVSARAVAPLPASETEMVSPGVLQPHT